MPRVAVLLPVRNGVKTIKAALISTIRALPPDSMIYVYDDLSTDGTVAEVESLRSQRVQIVSGSGLGVGGALNALLETTDSEIVARMDSDDLSLPWRFRLQLPALRESDVVFGGVINFGAGVRLARPSALRGLTPHAFSMALLAANPVAHSTMVARRSSLENVGAYRHTPAEDYDLWLRIAANGGKLVKLAAPVLAYRHHQNQVTSAEQWFDSAARHPALIASFRELRAHKGFGDELTENAFRTHVLADAAISHRQKQFILRRASGDSRLLKSQSASANRGPVRKVTMVDALRALKKDITANRREPKSQIALITFRLSQAAMGDLDAPRRRSFPLIVLHRFVTEVVFGFELRPKTSVGPGLSIYHGFGLVVNDKAQIGSGVKLRNGVTLGHKRSDEGAPRLHDEVEVGANATLIGDITIGEGAIIGAGAVVVKDVPAGSTVVGNPARILGETP